MLALLALHLVVGSTVVATGARLGRRALLVGAVPPAVTLVWLATRLGDITGGEAVTQRVTWVPALGLTLDIRVDGLAAVMALLVTGVGVLVFAYGHRYFAVDAPGVGRLAGLLTLFAGAMLTVVTADDLLLLYTGWELTSITSYLLIGNRHTEAKARAAALHALLVTSAGGLAMLAGFVLVGQAAGTFRLSGILADPPAGTAVSVGVVLVLLGAFTKSAQYPFHGWLPGAMAAPTPVSAYLHSATMVKAGVYLVARLAPAFVVLGFWRPLVLGVGLLTMIGGGLRALRQHDLKLLLAYGTVSQLGFLVVLFGAGTPAAATAGCVLLLAHGAFKAALFLVVGTLEKHLGTRDLRELPVLAPGWRPVAAVLVAAAASMAGVIPVLGFVAKEAAYAAFEHGDVPGHALVLAAVVVGSALTAGYSLRFAWGVLVAPRRAGRPVSERDPAVAFVAPMVVLTVLTVGLGLVPSLLDRLVAAATGGHAHLALWHGINLPLLLSLASLGAGVLLQAGAPAVERGLAVGERVPSSSDSYLALLRGLNRVADRVTGIVQSGSLPVYAGVIVLTAAVLPGVALLRGAAWPGWPELVDVPAHLPVVAVLVGAAVAAAAIRRRLSAVLFLGVAGYGMAGLFVVQGAPDLALTQVAVETLSTVLFVLVLRHFPDRFEPRSTRRRRATRVAIATAVGLMVFAFAIVAGSSRTATPVADEMIERALPDGNGRNVVNVILVDIRGFDTMGEITVLASAAIGMVALARAGRRPPRSQRRAQELEEATA